MNRTTSPNTNEPIRSLIEGAGFSLTNTGGGIEQYLKTNPDGTYLIITDAEGEQPTSIMASCVVGFYSAEGDSIKFESCENLHDALRVAG